MTVIPFRTEIICCIECVVDDVCLNSHLLPLSPRSFALSSSEASLSKHECTHIWIYLHVPTRMNGEVLSLFMSYAVFLDRVIRDRPGRSFTHRHVLHNETLERSRDRLSDSLLCFVLVSARVDGPPLSCVRPSLQPCRWIRFLFKYLKCVPMYVQCGRMCFASKPLFFCDDSLEAWRTTDPRTEQNPREKMFKDIQGRRGSASGRCS